MTGQVIGTPLRAIQLQLAFRAGEPGMVRKPSLMVVLGRFPGPRIARPLEAPALISNRVVDGDVALPLARDLEALRLEGRDHGLPIVDAAFSDRGFDEGIEHFTRVLLDRLASTQGSGALVVDLRR